MLECFQKQVVELVIVLIKKLKLFDGKNYSHNDLCSPYLCIGLIVTYAPKHLFWMQ